MEAAPGLFLKGLLFGVSLAAPVGPMALLCIRATLTRGLPGGLASGLGVAIGDASLAITAAFGLAAASILASSAGRLVAFIGGLYLLWFGARTMLLPPPARVTAQPIDVRSALGLLGRSFLLTLANPPTLMIFAALFAGLGLVGTGAEPIAGVAVVAGVFLGSFGWWVALVTAISRLGARLEPGVLAAINRVSGAALAGFGAYSIIRTVW